MTVIWYTLLIIGIGLLLLYILALNLFKINCEIDVLRKCVASIDKLEHTLESKCIISEDASEDKE